MVDNGVIEMIIPLTYGIRIGHFSFCDGENVFFEQPKEMQDLTTTAGWRIRGGHRLWVAPESENVYYPDNEPVSYEIHGEEIVLRQKEDPWLHVKKSMRICFEEGASVRIVHKIQNTGCKKIEGSLWAISVMAPGGVQHIPLKLREGGLDHWHRISMWDYTSMGDPRAVYTRSEIRLTHLPMDEKYKIGVGHPFGGVWYKNRGVIFEKKFSVQENKTYPDGNVSYESFLCRHMVEMESLSLCREIMRGESMEHSEVWTLRKVENQEEK